MQMSELRLIAIDEVEAAVQSEQLTDFHEHYRQVLKAYDAENDEEHDSDRESVSAVDSCEEEDPAVPPPMFPPAAEETASSQATKAQDRQSNRFGKP